MIDKMAILLSYFIILVLFPEWSRFNRFCRLNLNIVSVFWIIFKNKISSLHVTKSWCTYLFKVLMLSKEVACTWLKSLQSPTRNLHVLNSLEMKTAISWHQLSFSFVFSFCKTNKWWKYFLKINWARKIK